MRVHACVCGRQRVHVRVRVRVRVRACVDLQKWGSDDCRMHMLDDWVRLSVNHRTTTWGRCSPASNVQPLTSAAVLKTGRTIFFQ